MAPAAPGWRALAVILVIMAGAGRIVMQLDLHPSRLPAERPASGGGRRDWDTSLAITATRCSGPEIKSRALHNCNPSRAFAVLTWLPPAPLLPLHNPPLRPTSNLSGRLQPSGSARWFPARSACGLRLKPVTQHHFLSRIKCNGLLAAGSSVVFPLAVRTSTQPCCLAVAWANPVRMLDVTEQRQQKALF